MFAFPRSIDDYDIEVMTSAIPNKIGAMKSITVPYRITRRITTVSLIKSLFEEVTGYGGGNCVKNFNITIKGKCVICPNTAAARIVEKIVNYLISIFQDCPSTVTPSSIYTGGGGLIYVIPSTTGQGGGGGLPGSSSTPIQTSNPCNCKDEGTVLPDSDSHDCQKQACINGSPVTIADDGEKPLEECKECVYDTLTDKPYGTLCKDDGNPSTIDICKDGICIHISTSCDVTVGYNGTQNKYDDIIKCVAIAQGINPLTIKEIIKAESSFNKDVVVKEQMEQITKTNGVRP